MIRRAAIAAAYIVAFVLPPAATTLFLASRGMSGGDSLARNTATAAIAVSPVKVEHVPGKPVAAILVSNELTEVTDLLAPFAILSASGEFNVYTVAPERRVSNVWPGAAVLPDFSYEEFGKRFPGGADLIVVPYFGDYDNPALVDWLRRNSKPDVRVLSVCEGARTVAAAGLLRGRKATTHFYSLPELRETYPDTMWVGDIRAIADANVVSSGGVTAAIDAALLTVRTIAGADAAVRAAQAIGFDDDSHPERVVALGPSDVALFGLQAAYGWNTTNIGVVVSPGIDELRLAAFLDTFARTFEDRVVTLAATAEPIRSRYGLTLAPREILSNAPALDRLIVPSASPGDAALESWATQHGLRIERPPQTAPFAAYEQQLQSVAAARGAAMSRLVAKVIEFPSTRVDLSATRSGWPHIVALVLQPLALGFIGVVFMRWGIQRWRRP